ncbi:MAG TPA: methyltransferase domain-containing protein [Chitinivibrionales bacterium]|nr:methyltransferase domain-containing protein [Chitinivibrionales bacterium]
MPYQSGHLEFVRPADPDAILDSMTDEEYDKDKMLPYWPEQWPASFAMFNFMAGRGADAIPVDAWVVELGSGLGIVASVCARKGIRCVATDISIDACRFSRHNILLHEQKAFVICADWRHACLRPAIECVIASDIIYERRWIAPVLRFLNSTLSPGGTAFIADPCRQWWEEFKTCAYQAGFASSLAWEEYVNEGKTRVEILRFARRRD